VEHANYRTALRLCIEAIQRGDKHHELLLEVGQTPDALVTLPGLSISKLPLVIAAKTVDKVFFDHGITKPVLERLHTLVATPKAVYHSDTQPGSIVVVTLHAKQNAEPVIAAIRPGQVIGRQAFNVIVSVYSKRPDIEAKWTAKGLLIR